MLFKVDMLFIMGIWYDQTIYTYAEKYYYFYNMSF